MSVAHGRVALVTGSSRGLGAVIARRLAHDGLAVAVNGRRDDGQARDVGRGIRDGGGVAEAFFADVTDEREVTELVAAITGRFGPIDVLVLNATGPQPEAPVTDVAWADHLAQLNFFVKSPVLLGRAVPAGRMGTPGDIAHAVSFLASESAGFITGQRIVVDGGRSFGI
jgi:3-oxoacyl-[acyl-carrier protein] reductase